MFHSCPIDIKHLRWHRTVDGWAEKEPDGRSLRVEALSIQINPRSRLTFTPSNGGKLEELTVDINIVNSSDPRLGKESLNPDSIGTLVHRRFSLDGWFIVGPRNFEELWAEAIRPQVNATLRIMVGPLEYDGDCYTWDVKRNQRIFIQSAALHIVTEPEKEPVRKMRRFWNF
jgi:hypothetical protein